jgi:hypothetical protein
MARRVISISMQSPRLISAILLTSASVVLAQLPPSSVNPTRPSQPQPGVPAVRPTVPAAPAVPSAVPTAPASSAAPTDLSSGVPNTLTAAEVAQGWKLLFDGKRLIGWRGVQKSDPLAAGWKIVDGTITLPKDVQEMDKLTGGDLATIEPFWDFEFRFDWRGTASANSGVRYLVNTSVGQSMSGLEYQIIDDVHNTIGLKGGPIRRTGALDNVLPVGPNARLRSADPLNKVDEPWNEGRIVVQGARVEHWLKGEKVLEFALGPHLRTIAEKNYHKDELFSARPHALFGSKAKSPVVLLDQGMEVSFRNLKIRALAPQAVAPGTGQPGATGVAPRAPVPNPFLLSPKSSPAGTR